MIQSCVAGASCCVFTKDGAEEEQRGYVLESSHTGSYVTSPGLAGDLYNLAWLVPDINKAGFFDSPQEAIDAIARMANARGLGWVEDWVLREVRIVRRANYTYHTELL